MKQLFTILAVVLFSSAGFAQAYSNPESVEFDYAHNRWLIANQNAGNVLARSSSTGAVTVFASGMSSPHGLEIVNDTLYVCDGATLRLYNINTAASIVNLSLGATFLNGITNDGSYLYATDFTAKKIYRINVATRAFSIFVASTGTASPNGIIYDQPNSRCVFVNWGASAPINAMDIATGAITLITATTLGNNDGIAKDGAGNYYVSSWTGNKVTRFTNTFTTPTTVITGLSSPADIFYNTLTDTLGVPNSGTGNNTAYYYFGTVATGIDQQQKNDLKFSVSPNPVSKTAMIGYEIINSGKVIITLFDIKGQLVKTIADENQSAGSHSVLLDKSGLTAGNYFLKITTADQNETKKIVITE